MAAVKEPLNKIIDSNAEILKYCLAGVYESGFTDDVKALAEKEIANAMDAVREMTSKLQASRAETGYNKISEDSAGENVAALTFAKFAHLSIKLYEHLQKEMKTPHWYEGGIFSLVDPDVLFEKSHIQWTLRNGLSIVISFYIGWHGYNKYIASYNAAIASTVAVLLSKFVGSAMTKNLARLQGVVIGIVLGNLLYAFLGWCYWWGHLLVGLALYMWTLLGLFMYFHSANYSTVGLLLAVFGAQALLRPCANSDTDPSGHSAIVNVTVGICVMTIIDILLSPERASDMAKRNFKDACAATIESMDNLFDPEKETVDIQRTALADAINAAESMGNEAALEPRYWRHDWPEAKFNSAIASLKTLRFCLDSIESIMVNDDGKKSKVFMEAIKLDACCAPDGVRAKLKAHTANVMEAVENAIQDLAGNDVFIQRMDEVDVENLAARKTYGVIGRGSCVIRLCKELNTGAFGKEFMKAKSVQDICQDPLADCSLLVESLKAMFADLDATLEMCVYEQ
jgi:hypothetical protein